jgi:hypothetical protein
MEIAASIRGASKEYLADQTAITSLRPTTFDFLKKELTLIIAHQVQVKTTQGLLHHSKTICGKMNIKSSKYENAYHNNSRGYFINRLISIIYYYAN